MADHPQLDVHDLAYVCGGPKRVATVAVVALADDGQITVSRALHRVRAVRRAPRDEVEAAVLDALPDAGRPLGALIAAAAGSAAVAAIGAALRDRRILPRSFWQLGRIGRARRTRRRLRANPGRASAVSRSSGRTASPTRRCARCSRPQTRTSNCPT